MTQAGFARLTRITARGLSLVETIISFFLLATASLLIIALFHSGLQRSKLSQEESQARTLAQSALNNIVSLIAQGGFRSEADLTVFNKTQTPSDYPGFTVETRAETIPLTSPSTGEESLYAPDQRRVLKESTARIEVIVTWSNGDRKFKLLYLAEESPRTLQSVAIQGPTGPIAALNTANYKVICRDQSNRELNDLFFVWWVEPITANASISASRDTREATLTNQSRNENGNFTTSQGTCRIGVMARYKETEVIGYSAPITLVK